ncbi:MAG: ferritin-like protein [Acidimicrobiales bacterium]
MIKLQRSTLDGLRQAEPSLPHVRAALQRAVELEHATIPPYLYALYSLAPGRNGEIAKILKSVVVEEMLHMVLAANVLNALGGRPAISKTDFIPTYPGPLPGGVEGQLEIHLRPFSREQLAAFIEIEEPRHPLDDLPKLDEGAVGDCTIGEFYKTIAQALGRLGEPAFAGSARHQVGPDLVWGSVAVNDLASARRALDTIIEQGEGTGTSPVEIDGPSGQNDFAHYYRFMEIWEGRRLVPDSTVPHGYAFAGDLVAFDPAGVVGLPVDPTSADYPAGSERARLNDAFNDAYSQLLASIHRLTNGSADGSTFGESLGLMRSMERTARAMVAHVVTSGEPVGPTFEFRAVVAAGPR